MSKKPKNCFIKNCSAEPIVFCNCSFCNCRSEQVFICKIHEILHCELKEKHHFSKIHIEIDKETRKAALKQLYKLKFDLKGYKSKIIQEELSLIKEINSVAQKVLKSLKVQDQKINEYISKACNLKEIDNSKETTFIEALLKLSPKDLHNYVIKSPELLINHINSDDIGQLFDLEEITKQNLELDESEHLLKYTWSGSSTTLSIFDAKTLKQDKISLKIPNGQKLDQYGAKCLIPDGSLFYSNGTMTMIIDPKYTINLLPNYSQENFDAWAIYKDGDIYLIGGSSNISAKINLAKNRWTPLINIPLKLGRYTFGVIFKNNILLGSMNSNKILYYDIKIDSYGQISTPRLSNSTSKTLFVENEDVYLIEFSQHIFRSRDNFAAWDNIGTSSILAGNAPLISTPITYNHKFYFVNYYGIYSFDLKKKKIDNVIRLA
ncbi:unnamed protein product [Blepharisma stoltei]|uniref:Uncharacterized protein n=1 Tax=Blepharisma stoltei TaxID=1481888 RepID=A0AAU9JBS8_9CILI|nr:unnamed protein product [Blepharisma stoltei]